MSDERASDRHHAGAPGSGVPVGSLPDERPPAERVVAGLSILGTALRAKAWESSVGEDLNPTQGRILSFVLRAGPSGASLVSIADKLGVSSASASDSVSALEQKGLLKKLRDQEDRRALSIRLTPSGRAAARRVAEWPSEIVAAIQDLAPDDNATLLRVLVTLVRQLEAQGVIAPNRTCPTCRFFQPQTSERGDHRYYCAYVQAYFGDSSLRLDCREHEPADPAVADGNWRAFQEGGS